MSNIWNNLKISRKLVIGFGIIVLILLALSIMTYTNMKNITDATEMNIHTYKVISDLEELTLSMVNMETGQRGYSVTGDEKFLEPYNSGKTDFDNYFADVKGLTADNPSQQANLGKILSEKDSWLKIADQAIALRRGVSTGANTLDDVIGFEKAANGKTSMDNLRSQIDNSIGIEQTLLTQRTANSNSIVYASNWVLIFGTLLAILLAIFITATVTINITSGINKVTKAADTLAASNTDVVLNINNKDETGALAKSFNIIVSSLKALIGDMNHMADEHNAGDIDVRIDETKFDGAFRQVAASVNSMVAGHITDNKKAMACVAEFSRGNFEMPLEKFPGKKASINENIELLRTNLKALIADANMLVQAALEGRLSTRADASQHKGDFRKIVDGVNRTLDAVIEPVNEAADVLNEMSKGNLSVNMMGTYKGDHAAIKNAMNDTINTIRGYIGEISQALAEIASGNLNTSIENQYRGEFTQIKDSINNIADSLNIVLGDINNASEQVASGTRQVSAGSQALSQGATEQASAIEELTTSLADIAGQTKKNAVNANQANELAMTAMDNAVAGNAQMKEMQQAMAEINDASASISKIIKVIDEIAFQTNLLALNAAVEAARAGQHGKGFAVVAEEVRNLAQRSAAAAKETTSMIEESIKKTKEGTRMADETARALNQIVNGVEKATGLVGEIAKASNDQATAVAQVNKGIEQVSQVVQTNSATAEESAAASEELSSQAQILKEMVGRFSLRGQSLAGGQKASFQPTAQSKTLPEGKPGKPRISLSTNDFGKY